jgi:hypothetical protein
MKLTTFLIPSAICAGIIASAKPAYAGTAAYYSDCSFIDTGSDDGGDVLNMPCYIVEGGNAYSSFFYILWRDGTHTLMSTNTDTGVRVGTFGPLVYRELYRNSENDLIQIGGLEYTNDRFDVTEQNLADKIL